MSIIILRLSPLNYICTSVFLIFNNVSFKIIVILLSIILTSCSGDHNDIPKYSSEYIRDQLSDNNIAFLKSGETHFYETINMPPGSKISGKGTGFIMVSHCSSEPAIDMSSGGCTLSDLTITGKVIAPLCEDVDSFNSWQHKSRCIIVGSDCTIANVFHEYAGTGLEIRAESNITISNYTFSDIREFHGWGAGVHVTLSANNIVAIDIFGSDSDRGIEVEESSHDILFDGGQLTRIEPTGFIGQPEFYDDYTFVLSVHSHEGYGGCNNVVFKNFQIYECKGGVTAVRSTGENESDLPNKISFQNITIENTTDLDDDEYPLLTFQGSMIVASEIMILGRPSPKQDLCRIYKDSQDVYLDKIDFMDYSQKAINIENGTHSIEIRNCEFSNPKTTEYPVIEIDGEGCRITNNMFLISKPDSVLVRLGKRSSNCRVANNTAEINNRGFFDFGNNNEIIDNRFY